jgi:hypothetical protein
MRDYEEYHTAAAAKKRMERYDSYGDWLGPAFVGGLCGMAVASIFHTDIWWQLSAALTAVSGICLTFALIGYFGAKGTYDEARAKGDQSAAPRSGEPRV